MQTKKADRRIQRTRKLLQDALIALILEKGYDKLTVQDIIDQANVGRSTFYAHYLDKDDLMESSVEKLRAELEQHMSEEDDSGEGESFLPSLALFCHTQKQYHLYKAMIGGKGIDIVEKAINDALMSHAQVYYEQLESEGHQITIPVQVFTTYLAGSLQVLLTWWLANETPYSPERMDEAYRTLVQPGVYAVLGAAPAAP